MNKDTAQKISDLELRIRTLEEAHEALRHRFEYNLASESDFQRKRLGTNWFKQTDDGWVLTLDSNGNQRSLPSHLKIKVTSENEDRVHFRVEEGLFKGQNGSIVAGSGLLTTGNPIGQGDADMFLKQVEGPPVTIDGTTYEREIDLSYHGGTIGPFLATTGQHPIEPRSEHVLQIPDYPHDLGSEYGQYGTVWFRIGSSGDKYLHPGRGSRGCVTINPASWSEIYEKLVRLRRSDTKSVGILWVVD